MTVNARPKVLSVILMAILNSLNAGSTQNVTDYKNLLPASAEIIDVAQYLSATQTAGLRVLTVDADGRVGCTKLRGSSRTGFEKVGYDVLGQALWESGKLSLHERIPANEVPIVETRLTNPNTGTKFHAVATVYLSKTPHNRHMSKVYLFAEKDDQVSLALTKEYSDSPKIILDDVNADGIPELAVEFVEDTGKAGDLDIWSISSNDRLRKIELPDDSEYLTDARTYFRYFEGHYHGPGNYAVIATASILKNAIPIEREIRCQWNERTKSYLIIGVTDISETRRKVRLP